MRAATDRQNIAREAQIRWLARLLDHVQQTDPRASYSSLARDADLNANTLTRFPSGPGPRAACGAAAHALACVDNGLTSDYFRMMLPRI